MSGCAGPAGRTGCAVPTAGAIACKATAGSAARRSGATSAAPAGAFSDRTGTVFAHSNLPLSALFQALRLIAQREASESSADPDPEGVQALQGSLGVSRRTAVKWAERLRRALREDDLVRRLAQREL